MALPCLLLNPLPIPISKKEIKFETEVNVKIIPYCLCPTEFKYRGTNINLNTMLKPFKIRDMEAFLATTLDRPLILESFASK